LQKQKLFFLLVVVLISGCSGRSIFGPTQTPTPSQTHTPTITRTQFIKTATPSITPTITPRANPISVKTSKSIDEIAVIRIENHTPKQVVFTTDGLHLIVLFGNNAEESVIVEVINLETSEIINHIAISLEPYYVKISSDGLQVISYSNGLLRIQDSFTGNIQKELEIGGSWFYWSSDGSHLAVKSDKSVSIWDIRHGVIRKTITFDNFIHHLAFVPGNNLVSINSFDDLYIYDINSGENINILPVSSSDPNSYTFSPDGKHIATWAVYHQLREVETGNILTIADSSSEPIESWGYVFSPDSQWFGYCYRYENRNAAVDKVHIMDLKTGTMNRTFDLPLLTNPANPKAFSPDGRILVLIDDENTMELLDTDNGNIIASIITHYDDSRNFVFSPDGILFAFITNKSVSLWGVPSSNATTARYGITGEDRMGIGSVPLDWHPKGMESPRYLIETSYSYVRLGSCAYTGGHTLNISQQNTTVTIIDLETGLIIAEQIFYGQRNSTSIYDSCPNFWTFSETEGGVVVSRQDIEGYEKWLTDTMSIYGYTHPLLE